MPANYLNAFNVQGPDARPLMQAISNIPNQARANQNLLMKQQQMGIENQRADQRMNLLQRQDARAEKSQEFSIRNADRATQQKFMELSGKLWASDSDPNKANAIAAIEKYTGEPFDDDDKASIQAYAGMFKPEAPKPLSRAGKIQSDLRKGLLNQGQAETAMSKAIGTTVNVDRSSKFGTPKAGWEVITDTNTGAHTMRPIPGGPVDIKQKAAKKREDFAVKTDLDKAGVTQAAVEGIEEQYKTSGPPITGTASRLQSWLSSTSAGKVRSYVKTLQSGVALGAMLRLKKASSTGATGFGALSAKELDILISDIGALDPDTTDPEIFMETVRRIGRRQKRVVADIRRNVDPEKIKELGLGNLLKDTEASFSRMKQKYGIK